MRPSRSGVLLQRSQDRIPAIEVAGRVADDRATGGIPNQVVALGGEDTGYIVRGVVRYNAVLAIKEAAAVPDPAAA